MKIVVFGLTITSSWGNGHGTTYRALTRALAERGHTIIFFEHDVEWYASNRDLPNPEWCQVVLYEEWNEIVPRVHRELREADVAVVGSYFPEGVEVIERIADSAAIKVFYDIDTPITLAQLRKRGETAYLRAEQIPSFDIYFSFTGGPMLREIEQEFGAHCAVPLYCSFDPCRYHRYPVDQEYACAMSYMGTYAPDRQPKIDELLCGPARRLRQKKFIVAGPQYPPSLAWPGNVERIIHLNPCWHPHLYSSSRLTLNVTRRDMVMAGYSPSVRLFEAAACGAAIISDNWPGLEAFFTPGEEILVPASGDDVVRYILEYSDVEIESVGERAQARVLATHTNLQRALEFENHVAAVRKAVHLQ
ncbi:MAG: glycosyltransferase [Acidobacteria bacterium]|nr:MAG: glycosyltransferase [Acidobacteriota bacterium]